MSKLLIIANPSSLLQEKIAPKKKKKAKKAPKSDVAKSSAKVKAKKKKTKAKSSKGKAYVVMSATNDTPLAIYGTEEKAQLRALKEKYELPVGSKLSCRIYETPFIAK